MKSIQIVVMTVTSAVVTVADYLAKSVPMLFLPCADVIDAGQQQDRRDQRLLPGDDAGRLLSAVLVSEEYPGIGSAP